MYPTPRRGIDVDNLPPLKTNGIGGGSFGNQGAVNDNFCPSVVGAMYRKLVAIGYRLKFDQTALYYGEGVIRKNDDVAG